MTETQNKNKNRKRFSQRKRGTPSSNTKTNGNTTTRRNNLPKVRELKFYLHDSIGRKQSESFGKIREAIITKIQKTFEDSVDIVASLEARTKKVFDEPDEPEATTAGTAAEKA